ncbi:hypothetical protein ACEQPO_04215 [Bacillus sp. SL00103]
MGSESEMDQNFLQMNQVRLEDELAVVNISSTEIGALSKGSG